MQDWHCHLLEAEAIWTGNGSRCFVLIRAFLGQSGKMQRNAVLVGGTGTGKTHLAIAIARHCIRSAARVITMRNG